MTGSQQALRQFVHPMLELGDPLARSSKLGGELKSFLVGLASFADACGDDSTEGCDDGCEDGPEHPIAAVETGDPLHGQHGGTGARSGCGLTHSNGMPLYQSHCHCDDFPPIPP